MTVLGSRSSSAISALCKDIPVRHGEVREGSSSPYAGQAPPRASGGRGHVVVAAAITEDNKPKTVDTLRS
ncbi:hypothetical protein ON010_g8506 [Phytophthora cinnamomi]|nr:hypothetical protein ON010_g8506 [Phytophthora cinnamomi]